MTFYLLIHHRLTKDTDEIMKVVDLLRPSSCPDQSISYGSRSGVRQTSAGCARTMWHAVDSSMLGNSNTVTYKC